MRPGLDQTHPVQPIRKRSTGFFCTSDIAVDDQTINAVRKMFRIVPALQLDLLRAPGILADPTGRLAGVQGVVGVNFARRRWVWARCEQAMEKARSGFPLREQAPVHDQVIAWLFPTIPSNPAESITCA